jgi:alpha-1,3-rhamnosyltransferase
MQEPLVSVVVPCYNHEEYVQECIQGIIDQDYKNIELIIIDDGSSDKSVEEIRAMVPVCKERFERFEFRYRENRGLCATLNEALDWCKGEFFAPIASDDVLLPYKTTFQVNEYLAINRQDIAGIFGRIIAFSNDSPPNTAHSGSGSRSIYNFLDIFLRKSKNPAPTAMIRVEKLRRVGGYDTSIKIEDFYLWLKLTENSDSLLYIDQPLALYRQHPRNISKNSDVMLHSLLEILRNYSGHDFYKEAVARSYLIHAGYMAKNRKFSSISYLYLGLRKCPGLIFSKLFLAFFYRVYLGIIS